MYRKGDGDERKKMKKKLENVEQMKQRKSDKRKFLTNNR